MTGRLGRVHRMGRPSVTSIGTATGSPSPPYERMSLMPFDEDRRVVEDRYRAMQAAPAVSPPIHLKMDCEPGGQGLVCHPVDPGPAGSASSARFQAIAIAVRLGSLDCAGCGTWSLTVAMVIASRRATCLLLSPRRAGRRPALPAGEGLQAAITRLSGRESEHDERLTQVSRRFQVDRDPRVDADLAREAEQVLQRTAPRSPS